jgi:hypothetical protein
MRCCATWVLCISLPVLFAAAAFAQTGTIQGNVKDATGAAVAKAKVIAVDEGKQVVAREAITDASGRFQLLRLLRGMYTLKVESPGFKAIERTGLVLDPNAVMELGDLTLEVGQVTESVTVEAQVPLVETATADKGFVLPGRQVVEQSLNGRDFQSLIRTLPGAVSNDTSDFRLAFNNTDAFQINGLRGSMNNVYLDGSINTDVGANDGQYTQVSLDSVGEFKLQTNNFAAEFGRNPGVMIGISTKSGSSDFHGTAYEFLRNDALDANRYFANLQGAPKPKLRFNQFGGNIGGWAPLPKISSRANKRLFFFFNYEGTRAGRPDGGAFVDVPHADLLRGDFSRALRNDLIAGTNFRVGTVFQPGTLVRNSAGNITGGTPFPNNVVPASMWARNTTAFLKVINTLDYSRGVPLPNTPETVRVPLQDQYTFYKDGKVARVDYALNSRNNFFFRWADDSQKEQTGRGIFASNTYPVFPEYRKKPGASWSWNMINTISPTMTNEAIFTYNHLTQVVDVVPGTDPATYDREKLGFTFKELYPNANLDNKFPKFSAGSLTFSNFAAGWYSEGITYAFTDNVTKVVGKHTLKAGIFFNRNDNVQQPGWTDAMNINFNPGLDNSNDSGSGLANLLLGNYTSANQQNGQFLATFRFYSWEAFGQDSWKVNRKLTLEYGLRWAYMGPTYTYGKYLQHYFLQSAYDPSKAVSIVTNAPGSARQGSIVPNSGDPYNGLIEEGAKGLPLGGIKHRWNNFAPRIGIAFDPSGSGKMSIRGGFGMFYERIRQNNTNFGGVGNPPVLIQPTLYGGRVDDISPSLLAQGTLFPVGVVAINPDGKVPTIYSWSLDVQRELGGKASLDLAYVGNTTRHLEYQLDIGQLPLGASFLRLPGANNVANAIRPYRGFTGVTMSDFGANSNYHALQARVSRRFATRLTANASFVWSKALDQADTDTTTIGYYLDRRREWGPAGFDRTRTFTFDYVYMLPDWGSRSGGKVAKTLLNGWEISGVTRFWDGTPFTIGANGNPGTLGGGVRADYLGNAAPYADASVKGQFLRPALQYVNPFVWARPQDGSLGNTGRSILRGPGINQWDFSLFKNTNITERVRTQLRFEMFNIFNHTQFTNPNAGINVPNPGQAVSLSNVGTFGQFTNTRDPRNIQLALKLYF